MVPPQRAEHQMVVQQLGGKQQRLKCVALPTSILLGVANGCAKYDWSVYQNLSIFELRV